MNILIVEDRPGSALTLTALLNRTGCFSVYTAQSAGEAIQFLMSRTGEGGRCDCELVLMNTRLPDMDGHHLVSRIRSDPATRQVEIIMMGDRPLQSLEAALEAGALDFIRKPVDQAELSARCAAALKLRQRAHQVADLEEENRRLTRALSEANETVRRLTHCDGLTGAANRRALNETLRREWRRAAREGSPVSLVMVDMDFFKEYKDHFGLLQGDACLQSLAKAIRLTLRRPGDFLARYDREEFVALLPDTNRQGAVRVAGAILDAVTRLDLPHPGNKAGPAVTVSVGVSTAMPNTVERPSCLLKTAEDALYMAKSKGGNGFKELAVNGS